MLLIGHQVDDRIGRGGVDLGRMRAAQARHVARKFHNRHLHAQADAQERHAVLARIAHRGDLALQPARAEAAGHQHALRIPQALRCVLIRQLFGRHPVDLHARMVRDAAVRERLHDAHVCVRQLDVLAHQRDARRALRRQLALDHRAPLGQVRLGRVDPQQPADLAVQILRVQQQRHLIDGAGVLVVKDVFRRDVAKHRDLVAHLARDRVLRAADDHVRLNAQPRQLLDGVLRRLGLQLARRRDIGHERHMDVQAVFAPDLRAQLSDGLQKGLRLDVAHRAADLRDHHVRRRLVVRHLQHAPLDLVRDVRDDLDRRAQVFPFALAGDDRPVHAAAGDIGRLRQRLVDEPLVVPQVQIRLRAVVRHEHLAVLVRVHRAGIDVDVRVELLDRNAQAAAFQQPPQRRGRDALAQRGHDAARDEEKLGVHPLTPLSSAKNKKTDGLLYARPFYFVK